MSTTTLTPLTPLEESRQAVLAARAILAFRPIPVPVPASPPPPSFRSFSWQAARARNGHPKAVWTGGGQRRPLYGQAAIRALSSQSGAGANGNAGGGTVGRGGPPRSRVASTPPGRPPSATSQPVTTPPPRD